MSSSLVSLKGARYGLGSRFLSLTSLQKVTRGLYRGTSLRAMKGDTRSLDYGSYCRVMQVIRGFTVRVQAFSD